MIAAFFFVPETAYERPLSAYNGHQEAVPTIPGNVATLESQAVVTTQSNRPALDEDKYGPRTLKKDIRLLSKKMDWTEAYLLLKHCLEMVSRVVEPLNFKFIRSPCSRAVLLPQHADYRLDELLASQPRRFLPDT